MALEKVEREPWDMRIGKWMIRGGLAIAIPLASLGLLVGLHSVYTVVTTRLPGVDQKLVGTWKGPGSVGGEIVLELRRDGTGLSTRTLFATDGKRVFGGSRSFTWGAAEGVFHAKYMAVDSLAMPKMPYALSDNGRTMILHAVRNRYMFPRAMRRLE